MKSSYTQSNTIIAIRLKRNSFSAKNTPITFSENPYNKGKTKSNIKQTNKNIQLIFLSLELNHAHVIIHLISNQMYINPKSFYRLHVTHSLLHKKSFVITCAIFPLKLNYFFFPQNTDNKKNILFLSLSQFPKNIIL